jgi:aminotransferase
MAMTAPPRVNRSTEAFLAEAVADLAPSGIRRFFDMLNEMRDVISLTIGEPDFTTPEPFTQAAVASLGHGETHYTANGGMIELRRKVSAHLAARYGVTYDPRTELTITVGASEAVDASLRAILDPGDEVIYHEPCFVAYAPLIQLAGGVAVRVATREERQFRVSAEEIEAAVTPRTKAIFLGYPNNPTGAVLEPEELAEIAEVAARHDLLVLSDEIYDRLVYAGHRHVAFSSLHEMRERTILIGGFSKAYAMTGWRIGYVAAPAALMSGIAKIHQYAIMCAPTPAQHAAMAALETGEPYVLEMLNEYERRRTLMTQRFNEMGLPCFEPRGAFYCFPNITSTRLNDETFAQRLLAEERVAVVPGSAFGPSGAGYVRACYATAYEQIVEAMDRIERFATRCREG